MYLRCLNPKIFKDLFETLKDNNTDVILHFKPDSVKIRAWDHGKTTLTFVHLYSDSFDSYKCDRYQPAGINIPKLYQVFKCADPNDVLIMKMSSEDDFLEVIILDGKTQKVKVNTNYKLYFIEEEVLSIPDDMDFGSCITMKSGTLHGHFKNLDNMDAEWVKICQSITGDKQNQIDLVGMGSAWLKNPTFTVDELKSPNSTAETVVKLLEPLALTFDLKKMLHFTKAHCLDERVAIHLDPRGFVVLQYKVKTYGLLRFLLMARADDEDSEDSEDLDLGDAPVVQVEMLEDDDDNHEENQPIKREKGKEEEYEGEDERPVKRKKAR